MSKEDIKWQARKSAPTRNVNARFRSTSTIVVTTAKTRRRWATPRSSATANTNPALSERVGDAAAKLLRQFRPLVYPGSAGLEARVPIATSLRYCASAAEVRGPQRRKRYSFLSGGRGAEAPHYPNAGYRNDSTLSKTIRGAQRETLLPQGGSSATDCWLLTTGYFFAGVYCQMTPASCVPPREAVP